MFHVPGFVDGQFNVPFESYENVDSTVGCLKNPEHPGTPRNTPGTPGTSPEHPRNSLEQPRTAPEHPWNIP